MDTTHNKHAEAFKIIGDWAIQAEQLKEKFPILTDEDLKFEAGKENELLNRIASRLNKKRDDIIHIIQNGERGKP